MLDPNQPSHKEEPAMAWPVYDKDQHAKQGDEYLAWLRMWNVEPPADAATPAKASEPSEPEQPEDPSEPTPAAADDDYDEWTVAELQEELGKRELSKSGNKDQLIARLREDDAESDD